MSSTQAQDPELSGAIRHTSQAIIIDGNADEAAWASANEYSNFMKSASEDPDDEADLSASWKALWDEENIYFYIAVTDDETVTDDNMDWQDDSIEIYIDADALGKDEGPTVPDYNVDMDHPIYQLTITAGEIELRNGINHASWITANDDVSDLNAVTTFEGSNYTYELALPWSTLTDFSTSEILARGFFGLGFAVNDDDDRDGRDSQISWATESGELWHDPTVFPNVELLFPEGPGPDLFVSPGIDLGQLSAAEPTFSGILPVSNVGTENALTITGVTASGPDGALITIDEFPTTVGPGEAAEIKYTLAVARTGDFQFNIDVESDDVDEADRLKSVPISAAVINFAGPIAHFAFDEAADTTEMRDITGLGNHGTYDGVVLGQEALATGTSGSFDGTTVGTFGSLDASPTPENFTVSLWVKATSLGATQLLVGQGSPTFALMLSNGAPSWFSGANIEFSGEGDPFAVGDVHHIAATYDATGDSPTVTLYADGQPVGNLEGAEAISLDPDFWHIGSFNGSLGFDGLIDDVQIYDRALPAEEILGIFETPGVGGVPGSIDTGVDLGSLSDVTSPGDEIALVNGTNDDDGDAGDPPGAEGVENAINDTAQKYLNFLDLGSGFTVTPASGFTTVSAIRLYTANDVPQRDPASYRLEGGTSPDGPFTIIVEGLLDLPEERNLSDADLTLESAPNQVITFVNDVPYTSYRLTFPALKDAGNTNSMQIAEVELLGSEYTVPAPVISYDFNEGSGVTIGNGDGQPGELINAHAGAWVASGGPDGSGYLNFTQDGDLGADSQHILTSLNASDIPVSGEVDYTMMAWARFDDWTPPGVNNDDRMIFGQLNGDLLHNGARGSMYHIGHWGNDTTGGTVEIGEWHHVTFHYAAGTQTILVDGEVVATEDEKGPLGVEDEIVIGTTRGDQDRDFSGDLDDVRVYNSALPVSVIQGIVAQAAGGGGNNPGGSLGFLGDVSLIPDAGGLMFSLPEGATGDIEYSTDLINWETIATSVEGPYSDTDAARAGTPAGFYRAKQ